MSANDLFRACAGPNPEDLISLLFCHFSVARCSASVCPVSSRVAVHASRALSDPDKRRAGVGSLHLFAEEPDQRLHVELIERRALMLPVPDPTAHGAAVVFEFHSKKRCTRVKLDPRLLCAPTKAAGQSET